MTPKNFKTQGHALVYMVECAMASLEKARLVKRTSQSEILRLESIAVSGLEACRAFKLFDAAHESHCPRVATALSKEGT